MKTLMVKDVVKMLAEGKITKEQIFFFEDEVGYLMTDTIYINNCGILVKNFSTNCETEYDFTDNIFIENL